MRSLAPFLPFIVYHRSTAAAVPPTFQISQDQQLGNVTVVIFES
ncbi:hypothetical protein ACQU0X_27300 [Pseudovibrio ascidiaceicola]